MKKRPLYVWVQEFLKVLMNLQRGWPSSSRCQVATVLFSHFLRDTSCLVQNNCFCCLTNTQFSDSVPLFPPFPPPAWISFRWCFFRINKSLWQARTWFILLRKLCFFLTLHLFFHFCFQVPKQCYFFCITGIPLKPIPLKKMTIIPGAQAPWRYRLWKRKACFSVKGKPVTGHRISLPRSSTEVRFLVQTTAEKWHWYFVMLTPA